MVTGARLSTVTGPGLAALAVLAAALAGCTSSHSDQRAGAVPLIPWDAAVPRALQIHQRRPASPCRAGQLRVTGPGFVFTPAVVGGTGSVTLRNTGPRPCALTGRPTVRAVGAPTAPRQRQIALPASAPPFPAVVPPPATLLSLPPGASAALTVDWRNWCVPRATRRATRLVPPTALRVTVPGGGSINAGYNAVPACESPGQPSTFGVRPFQPAALPAGRPWTNSSVRARIHALPGSGRLHAKRGEPARFAIELHNASTTPLLFTRCPLLIEMLAPAGTPEVHQLNCAAAHPIAPGGSLWFEMRVEVPARAPAGNNGLFWELDPTGAGQPEAVSRLVVSP